MTNNKEKTIIDFAHHEVHDGDTFGIWFTDDTMGDNETINFAFKTPPLTTKEIHMIIEWSVLVGGTMEVIEAPTWTSQSGTATIPINANRNSDKVSTVLGDETSTVFAAHETALNVTTILTTNATVVQEQGIFAGAGNKTSSTRGTSELILKADTLYVVLLTCDGGSNAGHLHLRWYEYLPNVV